jgi:hypothetical protein
MARIRGNNRCSIKARNEVLETNAFGLEASIIGESIAISLKSNRRLKVREPNLRTVTVENVGAFRLNLVDPDLVLINIPGCKKKLRELHGLKEKQQYLTEVKKIWAKYTPALEEAWRGDEKKLRKAIKEKERLKAKLVRKRGEKQVEKMIKTYEAEIEQLERELAVVRERSFGDYARQNRRCREAQCRISEINRKFATSKKSRKKPLR